LVSAANHKQNDEKCGGTLLAATTARFSADGKVLVYFRLISCMLVNALEQTRFTEQCNRTGARTLPLAELSALHQELIMKNKTLQLSRAICLSLLVGTAFLGAANAATPATTPPMAHDMKGMDMKDMDMKGMDTMTSKDMKAHMMKSMQGMQSMTMTGNADKDFAAMMRMHHQCAVEMAQMQLTNGKNAEMKAMATKIVASQNKEITQFDTWIAKNK
jgi:Domain of unknown function (DUF305)